MDEDPVVAVVGPDASGKSALVDALRARGYRARHVAQEHSHVPDMWQRLAQPDILIYLDASYDVIRQRRNVTWDPDWLAEENRRLRHARTRADLYIDTDPLTPEEVLEHVLAHLGDEFGERRSSW